MITPSELKYILEIKWVQLKHDIDKPHGCTSLLMKIIVEAPLATAKVTD